MNNEGERIQKVLADAGVASRRKIEEMVCQGRISVNGHKAVVGMKIHPKRDVVAIDGVRLDLREKKRLWYLALNKPRGYVTTSEDEMGRRCVVELVEDIPERVYPVGRLDKNSEGLLFLTNDGAFANMIMHPSNHITKTYRVTVRPDISDEQAVRLAEGVVLDDGVRTAPATVVVLDKQPNRVVLQISIHEGRNRQIRRMCEAVGLTVARLKRTAVGPIQLGMLQPGEWRELTPGELIALRNAAGRAASPGASGISGMTSRPSAPKEKGRPRGGKEGKGTPVSESGTFQGRYSDSGRSDRAQRSSDSSRRPGEAGRRQKGAQNSHNREGGKAYLQAGRREKQPDSIRYGGRGSYSGVESRHGAPRASGDAGHPMQAGRERNGFRSEGKDKGRYGRPGTDSRGYGEKKGGRPAYGGKRNAGGSAPSRNRGR